MNVRLFDGPAETSPALMSRVQARIDRALKNVAQRVVEVRVWLADVNAAKGGLDKRCRIVAQVARRSPIVVESRSSDAYHAVDRAASKLRHAVERRLHHG